MAYRYMCTVLEEMRACYKSYNFSPMLGLIEELQIMGDKMEASLDKKNHKIWKLKDKIKKLKGED